MNPHESRYALLHRFCRLPDDSQWTKTDCCLIFNRSMSFIEEMVRQGVLKQRVSANPRRGEVIFWKSDIRKAMDSNFKMVGSSNKKAA